MNSVLLGVSLVWPKATVFEIVIAGSNPVPSAKNSSGYIVNLVDGGAWNSEAAGSNPATQTKNLCTGTREAQWH